MARITINDFLDRKVKGQKLALMTAYDYAFGRIVDEVGFEGILVGDSLSMVVQGLENTLPVTMDEMIYHTRIVSRAVTNALVIGDMPYLSYQVSVGDAVRNAGRFIKEGGAQAVKTEGGREILPQIKAMIAAEIPVMAHIGLTPQAVYRIGGFKVQGKTDEARVRLLEDALMLEDAGAFSIVIEAVPTGLAKEITEKLSIPTIGIGAGAHCDGQILVLHDVIGLFERFMPKFAKRYANLKEEALKALCTYRDEVRGGVFPSEKESFK
ncbi:MAG: 3-methyl-2-oxobutanoate hydroxymethyltransferase [Nitrospirae bacterium]|nr:3-methyl-2-oxobutanoate hydroxymethyltransferase [Nitrospirota bacterium]MBF0536411.1 3-methyl-2-oxobutanoate hydroxymethyltransferase [Nitrospirota bacterium]MBF0618333.1 3-methyl-2-oxobutanoate hydroxymethyltransferase [Nitrospirota bacterium]